MEPVVVSGYVVARADGAPMPGAAVYVERGDSLAGTITSGDGSFSLAVYPGERVLVRYVGYVTQAFEAPEVPPADPLRVAMSVQVFDLGEGAEVFGDRPNDNDKDAPDNASKDDAAGVGSLLILLLLAAGTRRAGISL